jgi:hypothetical protein
VINRERVGELLADGNASFTGEQLLTRLEDNGYRVVRAGMVPMLDDLETVANMLHARPQVRTGGVMQRRDAVAAAELLDELRSWAIVLLRLDPDDVDDVDGPA